MLDIDHVASLPTNRRRMRRKWKKRDKRKEEKKCEISISDVTMDYCKWPHEENVSLDKKWLHLNLSALLRFLLSDATEIKWICSHKNNMVLAVTQIVCIATINSFNTWRDNVPHVRKVMSPDIDQYKSVEIGKHVPRQCAPIDRLRRCWSFTKWKF